MIGLTYLEEKDSRIGVLSECTLAQHPNSRTPPVNYLDGHKNNSIICLALFSAERNPD
jgi:hypothetical protein